MSESLPLVMLGAGGHARVLQALMAASGRRLLGVCDPALVASGQRAWHGIAVLGADDALLQFGCDAVGVVNGLGQLVGESRRETLFARWSALGYRFPALVHPAAWVADGVLLGAGVQIMAGAVVQPGCTVGDGTIINTRAGIDHDCSIGPHVHIAPGATLCGGVTLGAGVFVGAGATVVQGITVGAKAVVGAGATLVRNLECGAQVLGAPVRRNQQFPESI